MKKPPIMPKLFYDMTGLPGVRAITVKKNQSPFSTYKLYRAYKIRIKDLKKWEIIFRINYDGSYRTFWSKKIPIVSDLDLVLEEKLDPKVQNLLLFNIEIFRNQLGQSSQEM